MAEVGSKTFANNPDRLSSIAEQLYTGFLSVHPFGLDCLPESTREARRALPVAHQHCVGFIQWAHARSGRYQRHLHSVDEDIRASLFAKVRSSSGAARAPHISHSAVLTEKRSWLSCQKSVSAPVGPRRGGAGPGSHTTDASRSPRAICASRFPRS